MKQFFEEYGGVIIVVIVLAALVLLLGNQNNGIISEIGGAISGWIDNFGGFVPSTPIP